MYIHCTCITCGCSVLKGEYESVIASACFWRWVHVPVSSNYLNKGSAWKFLVATVAVCVCVRVCVWLKFEHAFSMHSSPALKRLSAVKTCSSPAPEVFLSSTINPFIFYLEGGSETPKKNKNEGRSFCKKSFQWGMGLKKVQKQGRDERLQKDYLQEDYPQEDYRRLGNFHCEKIFGDHL